MRAEAQRGDLESARRLQWRARDDHDVVAISNMLQRKQPRIAAALVARRA
jgi:hypothetical protein